MGSGMFENMSSSVTGISQGTGQLVAGIVQKRKAKKLRAGIPEEDPEIRSEINRVKRIRDNIFSGTRYSAAKRLIGESLASQTEGVLQSAGGGGAQLAALGRVGAGGMKMMNEILAQGQKDSQFFYGLGSNLITENAQRKLELGLMDLSKMEALSATNLKEGTANLTAGIVQAGAFVDDMMESMYGGGGMGGGSGGGGMGGMGDMMGMIGGMGGGSGGGGTAP